MYPDKYRADIDGLRAIAVMSVVVHHFFTGLLPGGFVGVDIFFVISGFLISSQIYREASVGEFSLRTFYKRRINRIVPALLVVVLVSLLLGVFVLSPRDLTRMGVSAFLSLVGGSNFFFWREYGSYFAGDSSEAILLHTWSLGVEEQFYLLWPLFILVLVKWVPRYIVPIVVTLTVLAVGLSEYGSRTFASASYYLLPTRLFELMIGGVLAIVLTRRPQVFSPRLASLATVAGLGLIGYPLVSLSKDSVFPGLNALLPCLGTGLLIYAGSGGASSRILANTPMSFIGLISYSLYLWHWPIAAFLNYLDVPMSFGLGFLAIAASVFLAWLSWKYIEVPFRRSGVKLGFGRVFAFRFAVPACVIFLGCALVLETHGFPQRFDAKVATLEAMASAKPEELRAGCHVPAALYWMPPDPKCVLGARAAGAARVDGILLGDSFANHFTGMVDVLAKRDRITVMGAITESGG